MESIEGDSLMQMQDKIGLLQFNPDDTYQHIVISDPEQCMKCLEKHCLNICPTDVFKWDYQSDSPILVYYKQCVECGACRLACPFQNVVFNYPQNGLGVTFKEG